MIAEDLAHVKTYKEEAGQVERLLLRIHPDVSQALGIGRSKAYALVASGEIRAVKLSEKSLRVTPAALRDYVARLEEG